MGTFSLGQRKQLALWALTGAWKFPATPPINRPSLAEYSPAIKLLSHNDLRPDPEYSANLFVSGVSRAQKSARG